MLLASGWDNILTALLPFLLLFGFWIFLMNRIKGKTPPAQEPVVEKLEEIRLELERIRRAIESRS